MTNDEIRDLALSHGFTLRSQPDGAMDLNPYVYAFARTLIEKERKACAKEAERQTEGEDPGCCVGLGLSIADAIRARGES